MPKYEKEFVYVVTRDQRRVSSTNHRTHESASSEAQLWLRVKANWDPSTKVEIRKTDDPQSIR